MSNHYPRRRTHTPSSRPLIAFLLIASFGILFAGCGPLSSPGGQEEEFSFTEEDVARFRELAREAETESGSGFVPRLDTEDTSAGLGSGEDEIPVIDLSNIETFNSIRSGLGAVGENAYRVTNEFLNVRSEPRVTATAVSRLVKGDAVELIEFKDAAWAKVRLADDTEGFVSTRYISKLVGEENLATEKAKFEGQYLVDFGFLNVRKSPDTESEKLGELPGQAIIIPSHMDEVWARIPFEGKEGYVAIQYLTPFLPNFLVRQEEFILPVLHYRLNQEGLTDAMSQHIDRLKTDGYKIITIQDLYNNLLAQEDRDVRLDPKSVLLMVSDINSGNVTAVSDALRASNAKATLFITTKYIGIDGITEKQILTLLANGLDLQSGGHTGDDLRSLTNAQLELELKQSRKLIEEYTSRPVVAIAYPMGGVNLRTMDKAAESGYLFGIGSAPTRTFSRGELLKMPSYLISSSMTAGDVAAIVKGE